VKTAFRFEYRTSTPGFCPQDGKASFTPETVDELIVTVRETIEPAKHARERRSMSTEYMVSIG
jgi:hypothetical protein